MLNTRNNENKQCAKPYLGSVGTKLLFLVVGGGIGAAIALLFAPKPGQELRADISDAARKGFDDVTEKAKRVQKQTFEYYETVKEKGIEVLDVAKGDAVSIKNEISNDAARIGGMLHDAKKDVVAAVKTN